MSNVFFILAMLSMLPVVAVFMFGMVAMTKGGKEQNLRSNKMMQLRVLFQGGAILFLFLAYITK